MGKRVSRPPATKTSSAAVSGGSNAGNKTSILRASFAPSDYQLALFASVIQGLEGQHIRIHDTNTGRLQCEHVLGPRETVTSLDWGYYQSKPKEQPKKKRKRHSGVNGGADGFEQGDVVVAFGTSASDIRLYSPTEDKIVGTLSGGHEKGVKDFKFTSNRPGQEGWSIGGDNKLVQWDLRTGKPTKSIPMPASSVLSGLSRPLPSNPPVICASEKAYIVDVENDVPPTPFPDMRNPIQTILTSSTESAAAGLFLASDNDRFLNIYDPQSQKLLMNLVADNEVSSLSLYTATDREAADVSLEKQVLAAVTEDGTIELFTRPFVKPAEPQGSKGSSLKAKRQLATKRAEASIKLVRSEGSNALASVVNVQFQGPDLIIASAEGGSIPVFERIKWLNEETDELAFTGTKTIAKTQSAHILASATTNGAKSARETQVDDTKAGVEQGAFAEDDVEMQDSKQDAASVADSEEEDSDDDDQQPEQSTEKAVQKQKEAADSDVDMDNAPGSDQENEEEEETGEPSFGELMRAHTAGEIDVEAELEDGVRIGSLVPGKPSAAVQPVPTGVSLSTVLTQSLKTNDNAMLESCFHTGDTTIIRTTIQRLESSLAATLLQKLAERISSRPGRYGHLLVWVQWTCVAHGGALAGKPELLKRMSTLFKVMDQRSSSLPSLLLLKGKLDMLDAQLGLRKSIRSGAEDMDSEDEDNIIYVEGQEEEEEDSDAENKNNATPRTKLIRDQTFDDDESMVNGVHSGIDDSDNEEDEEEEDEDENVLDVEAEESAGSSDAEESPDEDEEDDEDAESVGSMADFIADTEDEASDDEGAAVSQQPPSKKAKLGGGKGKNKARK
ncbi:Small subunit (SSU) processome component [Aspergillus melleus]|uniref:Small subunit (SSU) processome component n=1 Tax=Aspergillus melleus TaxID=138277 RepID=A0ACC3ANY4_9EURO|nr:Small subunit (SSU) processome component [Aspergillus melleus]